MRPGSGALAYRTFTTMAAGGGRGGHDKRQAIHQCPPKPRPIVLDAI